MSPRQVDHHGERHPVPEEISHDGGERIGWPTLAIRRKSFFIISAVEKQVQQHRDPTPHLYGPVSQLLGVGFPLLKREDTVSTHYPVVWPAWPQWGHEELSWKICLSPRGTSMWVARKNHHKWGSSRKIAGPVSCGQFLRVEGLILLLIEGTSDSYLQEVSSQNYC